MAIKHRKLFPKTIQQEQNQTINCPVFCDPSCPFPHNCWPFPDPKLIFPPPPPINYASPNPPISPFIIITITLLASLFLLISYYAIIIKHCGDCSRSNNTLNSQSNGGRGDDDGGENDDDGDYDQNGRRVIIDHPIWLIASVGLNQSVINSIAVCKYKKSDGLIQESDCSVCLSEFQEDETVRLLPKCNHAFHTSCIDTWLNSHTNCPLCRARIVSETPNLGSTEQDSVQNLSFEETQIENNQNDDELSENHQIRNNNEYGENRGETEDMSQINVDLNQNDVFSHNHQTNSVHKPQNLEDQNEITQLRRTNSMYCFSSTTSKCFNSDELKLDVKEFGLYDDDLVKRDNLLLQSSSVGSSSNEGNLGNGHILINRSFSYGGGRSFWPRHNRILNSSLPL